MYFQNPHFVHVKVCKKYLTNNNINNKIVIRMYVIVCIDILMELNIYFLHKY